MNQLNVRHAFGMLSFQFTVDEIRTAMRKAIVKIEEKIFERKGRIARLREEHGLDDKKLAELLVQLAHAPSMVRAQTMSYVNSAIGDDDEQPQPQVVGAGAVQALTTEQGLIESEKKAVERLKLLERNLRPIVIHTQESGIGYPSDRFHLSVEEMEFLEL